MKLVDRTAVRQCEAGDSFTESYAPSGQFLNVLADNVASSRITFRVVVEVNDAGVEGHYVAHFVDEYFERVFDVERGAERARNLVERVDLAMSFLDLIVGDEEPRSRVCAMSTVLS